MSQNEHEPVEIPDGPDVALPGTGAVRRDYLGDGLAESDVADSPYAQVRRWVDDAVELSLTREDVYEPTAMHVATVDEDGVPNVRTVLMRFLDERGPGFVTNMYSTKGVELKRNPHAAAVLTWPALFRQLRFRGRVELVEREAVEEYFNSRPYGSRLSAWASEQSQRALGREQLEDAWQSVLKRFPDSGDGSVPVPPFWGGYRIVPDEVELWAGRQNRLHDRIVFRRVGEGTLADPEAWTRYRRQP